MTRILFLSTYDACRGQMAEGFARAKDCERFEAVSAGLEPKGLLPLAVKVMAEVGIDISRQNSQALAQMESQAFEVVVTLSPEAAERCPMLPGHPVMVHWNVDDPDATKADAEKIKTAFRKCRDEIRRLVDDFFEQGYVTSLIEAKRCENLILENISDGIIAHDMHRRVFYFNKAAEEITGYSRDEVVGRDCHAVFPGNFCGGKCRFDAHAIPEIDFERREVDLATKDGERHTVDMRLKFIVDAQGERKGVLASFRDLTRERRLARRVREVQQFSGIIGHDERMLEVFDLIRDLAETNVPVIIQGESGTGKELVAAAIHNEGPRASRLFVPVNCGALPESLLESELFGHVKGAFTGAIRDKKGRFELADGGTIFLDEIGDISPAMQVKLMRVLQEGTFERVGSETTVRVDVRVISATNKNLSEEIATGRFREDLFYRLSVVPLNLPPLRERRNDIPLLAEHVLKHALENAGKSGVSLSQDALNVMMSYDWPGNVRELQNWIQFALVKCKGPVIMPEHLPPLRMGATRPSHPPRRRRLEIGAVRRALEEAKGNKVEAAQRLGVSRATLYRFLDAAGL